jgi:CRP-like cAMP-binding protein
MAQDVRQLREEAAAAAAAGKHKRALAAYLELERLEPRDAQWSKRAAETYRRIGKDKDAISAYARSADRYAQSGFLVQAIAVCKLILQIDPKNDDALRRIATMNEQIGAAPTRVATIAEHNPTLAENTAVNALMRATGQSRPPPLAEDRRRRQSSHPPLTVPRTVTPKDIAISRTYTPTGPTVSRTKSKPITLPPGQGIDSVQLNKEFPNAFEREESSGVYVIPINGDETADFVDEVGTPPVIEIEEPTSTIDVAPVEVDEATELDMSDIEEIPLPEPRVVAAAAAAALASTPLFAGLPREALEAMVEHLQLMPLGKDELLFREGDPGDALYVIVEGEVAVQAEGPPRVEMARLGAGSFIGEVALLTDQPRSATVTATAESELLRIDRGTLARVLASHGEVLTSLLRFVRDRLVDRWTRTSPLFRPFDAGQRAEIAGRFSFLEIQDGSVLLASGARPDGLYIVLAGQFAVRRGGVQVAALGPGDLIGETALLSGGVFRSTVVANGKALALCLPASDFRELIMSHPQVLEYIGEHAELSRKLQIL